MYSSNVLTVYPTDNCNDVVTSSLSLYLIIIDMIKKITRRKSYARIGINKWHAMSSGNRPFYFIGCFEDSREYIFFAL